MVLMLYDCEELRLPTAAPPQGEARSGNIGHVVEDDQLTTHRRPGARGADVARPARDKARAGLVARYVEDQMRMESVLRPVDDGRVPSIDAVDSVLVDARRLLPRVRRVVHALEKVWPVWRVQTLRVSKTWRRKTRAEDH